MSNKDHLGLASRLAAFAEKPTYFPVISWNISPEAKRLLKKSSGTLVITGNMPDKIATGKDRYRDTDERWGAQKAAINLEFEEWSAEMIGSGQKVLTVALCSGSRGVDLDTYATIQEKRKEVADKGIKIKVVSFLPLEPESFKEESVKGSIREKEYVQLFNDLLLDPDAFVHQPNFVWYSPKQRKTMERTAIEQGLAQKVDKHVIPPHVSVPVTGDFALSHGEDVNGKGNGYTNYSDTQRQLMNAVLSTRHPEKARFIIVTDGGEAYGPGGTNEMVARIFDLNGYRSNLEKRRSKELPTVRVIQDGLTVKRPLPWYIDLPYSKGYGDPMFRQSLEYLAGVQKGYEDIIQPHSMRRARAEYLVRRGIGRRLASLAKPGEDASHAA